jgi:hypothetical protein
VSVEPTIDDLAEATLAEDATLWDKRMQALTMKNAGTTYQRIAAHFDIPVQRARDWVHRAIRDVVKLPVDQMVDRQRSILLDILRVTYPDAMDRSNPDRREAQGVIIRCLEHEAKLYGLYAPARVSVGISESEFGQQAADLLKLVGIGPLAEIAGMGQAELDALTQSVTPVPEKAVEPKSDGEIQPPPLDVTVVEAEDTSGGGWSNI